MTPKQSNVLKGLSFSAIGLAFGFGSAWIDTKRDIAEKADQKDLVAHIVQEKVRHDSLASGTDAIAASLCVGEKNDYKRVLLQCARRGIR